jgi:hypothetical protein
MGPPTTSVLGDVAAREEATLSATPGCACRLSVRTTLCAAAAM